MRRLPRSSFGLTLRVNFHVEVNVLPQQFCEDYHGFGSVDGGAPGLGEDLLLRSIFGDQQASGLCVSEARDSLSCMSRICPGVSSWMSSSKTSPREDDLLLKPPQPALLNTEEQRVESD